VNGGTKSATKVRDLTTRKGPGAKGGGMLSSASSSAVKSVGDALSTVARKQ
jgi:hypothetical protein